MKSPAPKGVAGNVNMKGKKHCGLLCRCCEMIDKREEYNEYLDNKEMVKAKHGLLDEEMHIAYMYDWDYLKD